MGWYRIIFAAFVSALGLHAQTGDLLNDFLVKVQSTEDLSLSDKALQSDLSRIEEQIPNIPRDRVADSIPATIALLTKGTVTQRSAAIMLLFEIARAQRDLLQPYMAQILHSLRDPSPAVNTFTEYILANLFPQPTSIVVPYLIDYVNDEKMDELFRSGAIGTLVWYSPNDPAVVSAIGGFLKAKHGREARAQALKGIGLEMQAGIARYSPELVAFVVDAVRNDPETRGESIRALGNCGWNAFTVANPVLAEIIMDEHESVENRDAARAAIDSILHSLHK